MANSSAVLPFDNNVLDGDQSLEVSMQAVAAVNGGNRPGVADIVRDTGGKLVQVRMVFPDAVAQAAVDAINTNPGVVTVCLNLPIPAQLAPAKLNPSGPDGIVYSKALGADERIVARGADGAGATFSPIMGDLLSTGYVDGGIPSGFFTHTILTFLNDDAVTSFTIATGDTLTLNYVSGPPVVISFLSDLVILPDTTLSVWVDATGKLYFLFREFSPERFTYDFSTACVGRV